MRGQKNRWGAGWAARMVLSAMVLLAAGSALEAVPLWDVGFDGDTPGAVPANGGGDGRGGQYSTNVCRGRNGQREGAGEPERGQREPK